MAENYLTVPEGQVYGGTRTTMEEQAKKTMKNVSSRLTKSKVSPKPSRKSTTTNQKLLSKILESDIFLSLSHFVFIFILR